MCAKGEEEEKKLHGNEGKIRAKEEEKDINNL